MTRQGDDRPADKSPTIPLPSSPVDLVLPVLTSGQVLAGRYRIVRFLSQGGMGEVWEAEDLEFPDEHVALKTVLPAIARDEWVIASFRREIQLGKRVTHPNVCRVYDLFHHRPSAENDPDGPRFEVTFLTMELLSGETLARCLDRQGPRSPEQALPIVRQMCEGLAAAHGAGVVHGDFKSPNVLLVEHADGPRAVITDFGLSRGAGAGRGQVTSMVGDGNVLGTPAYMAPEQMKGERPTAAADIYALGVVLFELVTGRLPFQGETPFAAALKRLTEPPTSPRTVVPDLDLRWERAILACLAPDAAERPPDARQVIRLLEGDERLAAGRSRRGGWRTWSAALVAAGVAIGIGVGIGRTGDDSPPVPVTVVAARPAIAVLGLQNTRREPEVEWIGEAFSEALATELSAAEDVRVVSGEAVARMRLELGLGSQHSFAADTLERIRRHLGCELILDGSFTALAGGQLRFEITLEDPRARGPVRVGESGTEEELFALVSAVASTLRRKLSLPGSGATVASFPTDPRVARLYAEGLALLRGFDALGARQLLQQAVELGPTEPLPRAALAEAWAALGYDQRAQQEAMTALEGAERLPRVQAKPIEALARELAGDWSGAIAAWKALLELFPDDLEHGLHLVAAQIEGGEGEAALATIAQLRRLPPNDENPRLDVAEAQVAAALARADEQLGLARRAIERGEAIGARLVVARARLLEGVALNQRGDTAAAESSIEQALLAYSELGDRAGAARALNQLGILAWHRGDNAEAERRYRGALTEFREIGNQRGVAGGLNNLGLVAWRRGDLAEARESFETAITAFREIGGRKEVADALSNLGMVQKLEGALETALDSHQRSLAIRQEIGDQRGQGISLNNLGRVLEERGLIADARQRFEQAEELFASIGDVKAEADALINIGSTAALLGDLAAAQNALATALEKKRSAADRAGEAVALAQLAQLALQRGRLSDAESQATESLAIRRELGAQRGALDALAILAEVALAGRQFEVAIERVGELRDLASKAENAADDGRSLLLEARALAGLGREPEAQDRAARAERLLRTPTDSGQRRELLFVAARLGFPSVADLEDRLLWEEQSARQAGLWPLALEAQLLHLVVAGRSSGQLLDRAALTVVREEASRRDLQLLASEAAGLLASADPSRPPS